VVEIVFRAEVESNNRRVFRDFIKWDAQVAREDEQESGTLWFDYFKDPRNSNAFFVYEAYRDEAAFDAHKQNEPFQCWDSLILPKVVTPIRFQPLFDRGQVKCFEGVLSQLDQELLKNLNEEIAELEERRDANAKQRFEDVLSDRLVFRWANRTVVNKHGFLKSLDDANPFTSRRTEDMKLISLKDQAVAILIVRTKRADGTENRYRNIRLFSKQAGRWTLVRWCNYDVMNPQSP
jgi:autoinducer 2-degrading protein